MKIATPFLALQQKGLPSSHWCLSEYRQVVAAIEAGDKDTVRQEAMLLHLAVGEKDIAQPISSLDLSVFSPDWVNYSA